MSSAVCLKRSSIERKGLWGPSRASRGHIVVWVEGSGRVLRLRRRSEVLALMETR
jgi:hypothetical protein